MIDHQNMYSSIHHNIQQECLQLEEKLSHIAAVKRMLIGFDVQNPEALRTLGMEALQNAAASVEQLASLPVLPQDSSALSDLTRLLGQVEPETLLPGEHLLQRITQSSSAKQAETSARFQALSTQVKSCQVRLYTRAAALRQDCAQREPYLQACLSCYEKLLVCTLAAEQGSANWNSYLQRSTDAASREALLYAS